MSAQGRGRAQPTAFALFAGSAYDPTAGAGRVAWQRPNGMALLQDATATIALPGTHPALGADRIAWRETDAIAIAALPGLQVLERIPAPGVDVLAVSELAVVWRTRDARGTDHLWTWSGGPRLLMAADAPSQLGRPALYGTTVLCHRTGPRGSRLLAIDAATGARETVREEPGAQLYQPATDGSRLLYVHATGRQQELRVGTLWPDDTTTDEVVLVHASPGRRDREHEPGRRVHRQGYRGRRPPPPPRAKGGVVATLWSTALTAETAYVTRLRAARGGARTADVLSVPAPAA